MAGWDSADLHDRMLLYLGRGHAGTFATDELWTSARLYLILSDAYEQVVTEIAPSFPEQVMGAPVLLTSADGGRTFTFPNGDYPFGHVEVYAKENGGRELYVSTYGDPGGDFVVEGSTIRSIGNRQRTYANGPYARYVAIPARLSASVQPVLAPDAARELILWRALVMAAEVSNGELDPLPWVQKYGDAKERWFGVWATQYATRGQAARGTSAQPWWYGIDGLVNI